MHGAVKCSASELLCLYGLLRHFAEVRLGDATRRATDAARRTTDAGSDDPIAGELLSFMLMCKAVDILLFAKRGALPLVVACLGVTKDQRRWLRVTSRLQTQLGASFSTLTSTRWPRALPSSAAWSRCGSASSLTPAAPPLGTEVGWQRRCPGLMG